MAYSKELLDFIGQLSPYMAQNLRQGLELGRWPDGKPLTARQKNLVLEALLIWEQQTNAEQPMGVVPKKKKPTDANTDANVQTLTIADLLPKDTLDR